MRHQDGVRADARRHRSHPLLGHESAVGRRLARVHRDRRLAREHLLDRDGHARRLRLQALVHLDLDRRSDRVAAVWQVDSELRRDSARRGARLLLADRDHLRDQVRRCGLLCLEPEPDPGRLLRLGADPALQLRRLRAAERRCRGDGEPAERRAALGLAERDHRRADVRDPDLLHPPRPACGQGDRHRRLHRRRDADLPRSTAAPLTRCSFS